MKKKKLNVWPGVRFGKDDRGNNSVIVPFHDVEGNLQTFQFINDFGKYFLTGYKANGSFFKLGEIGKTVYLGEGLATMLTIWEAFEKGETVISVGSANNIPHVIRGLKI